MDELKVKKNSSTIVSESCPKEQDAHYPIGVIWVNTLEDNVYILTSIKEENKAKWVLIGG